MLKGRHGFGPALGGGLLVELFEEDVGCIGSQDYG